MTILITGGAGFIGSHLAEKLIEFDNDVIIIDNFCNFYDPEIKKQNVKYATDKGAKLYEVDILNYDQLHDVFKKNDIDCVVHLAAMAGVGPSLKDPCLYQDINGMGTQNIFEIAKKFNVNKIIAASSSSVYGNCKEKMFSENLAVDRVISPYAATKKANEVMAHVYHSVYDMNIILFRFFTVYGPRQRPDLAISKFTKLMLEGEPITMYGDGTTSRDYTYVDDIVDGIIKGIEYLKKRSHVYEIVNLGSSHPVALSKMIETIANSLEVKAKIVQLEMQPGDVNKTYADISKAKRMLGYSPSVSFEQGIDSFTQWYRGKL